MTEKSRFKILIADPNMYWTRVLSNTLIEEEYEIMLAGDGLRALQVIDQGPIDLLICELNLSEILGDQLIKLIRKRPDCENLPIIIYTDMPRADWPQEAKLEAKHGLVKYEVEVSDLIKHIKEIKEAKKDN